MALNENRKLLDMRNEPEQVLLQRLFHENVEFFDQFDSVQQTLVTEPAIKFIAGNLENMRQIVIILKDRAGDSVDTTSFLDKLPVEIEIPVPSIPQPAAKFARVLLVKRRFRGTRSR